MEIDNLKEGQLLCQYNGIMDIEDLESMVPVTIYLSKLHIDVCSKIADTTKFNDIEKRVFTNFLSKNSKITKNITALISLVKSDKLNPLAIKYKYLDSDLLSDHIDISRIKLDNNASLCRQYIDVNQIKRMFIKLVVNKIYRLFFKKFTAESAIRSWVEITYTMYGDKYDESLILIYPFYLNIKRHINYIKHCFANYRMVTLCGLPYSFVDFVKIALSSKDKDLHCVHFEMNAYKKHARELTNIGVKSVYTSDEFEVGALVMSEVLQNAGAEVVNTAHGMSFGCPYVSYNLFKVYNSAQQEYYSHKSANVEYIAKPRSNTDPVNCIMNSVKSNKALIYIDSNYEQTGIKYSIDFEYKSIDACKNAGSLLGLDTYIKLHPNRIAPTDLTGHTISGVRVIRHLTEIKDKDPIFVSMYSAAYYDFRHLGPFIFIYDGFVSPIEIYGEEGLVVATLDNLAHVVKKYMTES